MKKSYLETIKDKLLEMKQENSKYWTREEGVADRIRTIKSARFLDRKTISIIRNDLRGFNGDMWDLTNRLVELCHGESVEFPSVEAFAVFVWYVFYGGSLKDLCYD